ncbi:MAG: hypothetical protein AAGA86_00235 [Bacteroidota bacterium]
MKYYLSLICLTVFLNAKAQKSSEMSPSYATIPEAPKTLGAGAVMSRMIDGLGFRYYWSTQGLSENELNYEPGGDARTIAQTMDHVLQLTQVVLMFAQKEAGKTERPEKDTIHTREATLANLAKASALFRAMDDASFTGKTESVSELTFWNYINGPIADALWHTGQITMLRRMAGNPIRPNLNFFKGTTRD